MVESVNRQQRRLLQRQGEVTDDGQPQTATTEPATTEAPEPRTARPVAAPANGRTSPRQFLHEVNVELRKVAWPTRAETTNYAVVVFVALVFVGALIFGLDLLFSSLANHIFV
jgi:preprotein translocase subunit SecE